MSYYIGATGEYIWEELLENTTSNVIIANHINLDAGPLSDAAQQIITDAAGTVLGDLIGETTQVPSALGQSLITLSALGLLAYNKLNRTSVQDVDSMVYSADYSSALTPAMFDDRVRIRYDSNNFSNVFYTVDGVKKGEILTSRINLLPVDSNNIDLYTSTGKVGIGTATPQTSLHTYHATDNILRLQTATSGKVSIEFARGTDIDGYTDYRFINDSGTFKLQYEDDEVGYIEGTANLFTILPAKINLYKDTEIFANVGIGTVPATSLHTYNAAANILRLQTAAVDGTNSIEFVRGNTTDPLNDYRLITDTAGKFKLQYSTNVLAYGGTGSDLINISATNINLYKNTEITGNVGIGTIPDATYKLDVLGTSRFIGNVGIATTPHATYPLDVLGTVNATAFRGDGANITGLNQDNLTLTTQKIYEKFNQTTFSVINDKINISPDVGSYTFNIIAYDRMFQTTAPTYLLSGKFTCIYEDRTGVFTLRPSEQITNKLILDYKVGDKLTFKNTALPLYDYLNDVNAFGETNQRWGKLILFKIANGTNWTGQGEEAYMTKIYEWKSETNQLINHSQGGAIYPWASTISLTLEAGFKYFLVKWWYNVDANYYIAPANEENQMNATNYGGQGFKMITAYSGTLNYIPQTPTPLPVMTTTTHGVALRGARLSLNTETATLSADIPTSADLITNMNLSHFTNNTGTSKVDISSSYVAPNATKLANIRTIAGVNFDGSGNINIPYANLSSIPTTWETSQIPDLGASKINSGTFDVLRIPDLGAGKINSGTFSADRIPDLGAGKITSGTLAVDRGGTGAGTFTLGGLLIGNTTGAFSQATGLTWTSATNLLTATNIAGAGSGITALNMGNAGSGTLAVGRGGTGAGTFTAGGLLIGNTTSAFSQATGLTWTDATNLLTATNIAGAGSAITALNMGNAGSGTLAVGRGGTGGTTFTAGGLLIGNTTSAFSQATGLTWTTATNLLTATNFSGNGSAITNLNAGNFASGILPVARGGTGTDTILEQSILIGSGANAITTYSGFTYDVANTSLRTDRITGAIFYSATVTNITDASIYISSTPTTTTAILKNIKTRNGEHIISTSSTSSSTIIENIFDNTTTNWTTATASYVKQANGTNTTGTNFPTVITSPSLTIYGEWIQVKFPRRTCVDDIRVLPFAGTTYPNSIFRWTLLGTNNVAGNNWIRIYTNTKTFLTSTEQTLLPALGNTNTIQYLYYRLVVNEILGVSGSATGTTLSLSLLNVRFMVKDTIMYNDAILCIGEPINTAPLANTILNINGGVDINGDINIGQGCSYRVNGIAQRSWSAGTPSTNIFYNDGNVGIGTTNPTNKLHIVNSSTGGNPDTGSISLYVYNPTNSAGQNSVIINRVAGSASGKVVYGFDVSGSYGYSIKMDANSSALRFNNNWEGAGTDTMTLFSNGEAVISGSKFVIKGNNSTGAPTLHLRHANNRTAFIHNNSDIFYILSGAVGATDTQDNWGIVANGRWPLEINLNNNNATFGGNVNAISLTSTNSIYASTYIDAGGTGGGYWKLDCPDNWIRLKDGGTGHRDFAANQLYAHANFTSPGLYSSGSSGGTPGDFFAVGQLVAGLYAVSQTNTDHLVVQQNYSSIGQYTQNVIKVGFGTFTGFHRCYTDDELYNNETDETIDIFKNKYVGRVVIATGKIKSDFTRKKPKPEPEPEPEPEIDEMTGMPKMKPLAPIGEQDEWYSEIDKDGITIEDAVPVIALSRQRKDKRVFGVLGGLRSTNNKDRLIVNSVGEGGICVSNTNGNIENGDYLQSSDLLGYGEKQDDDLLHNYTIAKATIDCDFQLDSPYYRCEEIENGVRVAFIACSYHCG